MHTDNYSNVSHTHIVYPQFYPRTHTHHTTLELFGEMDDSITMARIFSILFLAANYQLKSRRNMGTENH